MHYIFLDTNTWIYLSNGFNILNKKYEELHFKVFEFLIEKVEDGRLKILTNQIILDEWERNKAAAKDQIQQFQNKLKNLGDSLRSFNQFLDDEGQADSAKLLSKAKKLIEKRVKKHQEHIEQVELFLKTKATVIPITEKAKATATDMAIKKQAPFIGDKKNSTADAVILLSSIEYIERTFMDLPSYPENYFVSGNKGDFSDPTDVKKIHPDLAPYLEKTETQFYHRLADLTNEIEAEFLSEAESEWIELHYTQCPACEYEYADTLYYSDIYRILDPNKAGSSFDPNQLPLSFAEATPRTPILDQYSDMVDGLCNYCGQDFFVCSNCGELNKVESFNSPEPCEHQCGYYYYIDADIDKKGMVHNWEVKIVAVKKCQRCAETFLGLSDAGLCVDCEEEYGTNH